MVMILGHRGGRGLWPENSLTGFRNAIALGVDIIEFDIHLSADGVPVVVHDALLERTTLGNGPVAALTAAELAEVRLRNCEEEGIPSLERMLAAVAGSRVQLAVEIKTSVDASRYPGIEEKVLAMLARFGVRDRAMIVSFLPAVLERVRHLDREVGVMACVWRPQSELLGGLRAAIARWSAIDGCILAVKEEFLSENEALCRALVPPERLAVGVTNDPERIGYWLGQKVRHLSTDRPDIALDHRQRLPASEPPLSSH